MVPSFTMPQHHAALKEKLMEKDAHGSDVSQH